MSVISKLEAVFFALKPGTAEKVELYSSWANNPTWIEKARAIKWTRNAFYTGVALAAIASVAGHGLGSTTFVTLGCAISIYAVKRLYCVTEPLLKKVDSIVSCRLRQYNSREPFAKLANFRESN